MGGENPAARIWKNTNRLADQIRTEAQLVVQGLKSPGQIKRELMHDYDVSFHQAERLIDTEISYVLNKANLEQYRRYGVGKVTIVNLDVNDSSRATAQGAGATSPGGAIGTQPGAAAACAEAQRRQCVTCEKCKALEGQVFRIEDAPVLPIHPRCHCSYCVPAEGDDAEVTASGLDLASVYADAGVEGYERFPKDDGRKIVFSMAEIRSEPEVLRSGATAIPPVQLAEGIQDITAVYREQATPGIGEMLRETGYREDKHRAEIADAELLIKELGGLIHLRAERNGPNEKTPDYTWNGKDWEQKTVSGTTSVDNAIRKGAKQIAVNPGGIVLNMGESETKDGDVQAAIQKRFKRTALKTMDCVIIRHGSISRILRLTKR